MVFFFSVLHSIGRLYCYISGWYSTSGSSLLGELRALTRTITYEASCRQIIRLLEKVFIVNSERPG